MNQYEILEFDRIIEMLNENALTNRARKRISALRPTLDKRELMAWTGETTEARKVLDHIGSPPLLQVKQIREIAEAAGRGEMLSLEELEMMRQFSSSCQRLKRFLERCESIGSGIAGYGSGMDELSLIDEEITRCIRGERVNDDASKDLRDIRRHLSSISANIRQKLESILKSRKECFSESFVSNRNGHFTLPVKKEHKLQISGSVIDVSSTGSTYFIEPSSVAKLKGEFETLKIEESNEERKILYILSDLVAGYETEILREQREERGLPARSLAFAMGDSVIVHPEKKLGIVYQTVDGNGMIGVQIQKQKKLVNYKRLQLKASAKDLYPEDYDFSIIFDSVQTRKARKVMGKRHMPGLEIKDGEL